MKILQECSTDREWYANPTDAALGVLCSVCEPDLALLWESLSNSQVSVGENERSSGGTWEAKDFVYCLLCLHLRKRVAVLLQEGATGEVKNGSGLERQTGSDRSRL